MIVDWSLVSQLALVWLSATLLTLLTLRIATVIARRFEWQLLQWTLEGTFRTLLLWLPVLATRFALHRHELEPGWGPVLDHATQLVLILGAGWLLVALTGVLDRYFNAHYVLDVPDNLLARRIHTRFQLVRRTFLLVIGMVTLAGVLMTFPAARHLGAGLLASAGIAGIAVGIAARPTIEALIAGIQLAVTGILNIDDVVVVEGEWGRVEEISTTYVVVRLWDLRRLILPVKYFIERPFQNWTHSSAALLGAVSVEVDYATPVARVRAEVERILAASQQWNGEFWNLQVVDASERTMRLRVLVSARNADESWALRCEVREGLIDWLQRELPGSLPRLRVSSGDGEA